MKSLIRLLTLSILFILTCQDVLLKSKSDYVLRPSRKLDAVSSNNNFVAKLESYRQQLESMKNNLVSTKANALQELSNAVTKLSAAGMQLKRRA